MLAKLMKLVQKTLCTTGEVDLQSDSMTIMYWLASKGTWSKYVRNRVKAITELGEWKWHYIPTKENTNDLGTRGSSPPRLSEFWFKGPYWLSDKSSCPREPKNRDRISISKSYTTETGACADGAPARRNLNIGQRSMGKFIARKVCLLENTTNNKFTYNCTKRVKISGP